MKRYKIEDKDKLRIGEVFYAKRFDLTVDKSLCKGCVICGLVCPREAISFKPVSKGPDGRTLNRAIDIDENKCDYHGICAVACPFSAIKITMNGEEELPAVSRDAFPVLIRDIEIDSELCEPGCRKCEEKCPLDAVSVRFLPVTSEENAERKNKGLKELSEKTAVDVKKELCAACQICWMECPSNAVRVNKFFQGSLRIDQESCPDGCRSCLDVCPVNALYMNEEHKICVNDLNCIYCGACLNVCPNPEAIELTRTSVSHTPINSGAWNKALEKMTSTEGLDRELAAKRAERAREAVKNLKLSR
jgi:4Fe-4S ferredoxin